MADQAAGYPKVDMDEKLKIKICGLMTVEDCRIVNRYQPDYVGFVFASTRHQLTDEEASRLRQALDPGIPAVGVFVNDAIEHMVKLAASGTIQIIQLHGGEDEAYITALRARLFEATKDASWLERKAPSLKILRAMRIRGQAPPGGEEPAEALGADALLLDTWDSKAPGGTGKRFDLSLMPGIRMPWLLAGGIKPDNVRQVLDEAFAQMERVKGRGPMGVDVSSGVESIAMGGHKDEALVAKLMEEVRNYGG